MIRLISMLLVISLLCQSQMVFAMPGNRTQAVHSELFSRMERACSFILAQQDEYGAMNESGLINTDSNMLYAMMGLLAAYDLTKRTEYLSAVEKAAHWLMSVQNREGDWYLSYERRGNAYFPTLPSAYHRFASIRGVDTTMALFIHVAHELYSRTNRTDLRGRLLISAKRAHHFLLTHNYDPRDGLYWSSFHLKKGVETSTPPLTSYDKYQVKYAADNAETYLGLVAAAKWFAGAEGMEKAQSLKDNFHHFYDSDEKSYAVMLDDEGDRGMRPAYARFFVNGWSAYIFQDQTMFAESRLTMADLMEQNGSFPNKDNVYALSSLAFLLGESSAPVQSVRVKRAQEFLFSLQKESGGIMDDVNSKNTYVNIAGLFLLYLYEELREE